MISFVVLGRPQPAGSKRAFAHPHTGRIVVTDDAKQSRPWKQQVAATALAEATDTRLEGPVMLDLTFYVQRPKGHYRSGRNAHLLKDSAPEYPTTKPDTTKLTRAVEDALTSGGLWRDDSQVVTQIARKRYGVPERVEIRVDAYGEAAA